MICFLTAVQSAALFSLFRFEKLFSLILKAGRGGTSSQEANWHLPLDWGPFFMTGLIIIGSYLRKGIENDLRCNTSSPDPLVL